MKLSDNFTLAEMVRSQTARRLNIDNTPNEHQIEFMRELCVNVLQPIRDEFGPVRVTSGLRVPELNRAIGGSSSSQHCALNGAAADIDFGDNNAPVFKWICENVIFDQLIWEFGDESNPDWIHVSYNYGKNRGQILRAVKRNGKTKYIPMG